MMNEDRTVSKNPFKLKFLFEIIYSSRCSTKMNVPSSIQFPLNMKIDHSSFLRKVFYVVNIKAPTQF
jgi:hypothetical protein